jgi:hypothetical protein
VNGRSLRGLAAALGALGLGAVEILGGEVGGERQDAVPMPCRDTAAAPLAHGILLHAKQTGHPSVTPQAFQYPSVPVHETAILWDIKSTRQDKPCGAGQNVPFLRGY